MFDMILEGAGKIKARIEGKRQRHRLIKLKSLGMQIGKNVWLPASVSIDVNHCFLISIGNNCSFGESCVITAHDAMMNPFLDATIIARVLIHDYCCFGTRVVILPGVEIGPNVIVGANSVVARDVAAGTVVAGNPAKEICGIEEYINRHKERMKTSPQFPYRAYDIKYITEDRKRDMIKKLLDSRGYIVGGYSEFLKRSELQNPDQ